MVLIKKPLFPYLAVSERKISQYRDTPPVSPHSLGLFQNPVLRFDKNCECNSHHCYRSMKDQLQIKASKYWGSNWGTIWGIEAQPACTAFQK